MWHTQPQPHQEQRPHCYELHEEVAGIWQGCSQDVGKLVRCLYDASDLLEECAANSALQIHTTAQNISNLQYLSGA